MVFDWMTVHTDRDIDRGVSHPSHHVVHAATLSEFVRTEAVSEIVKSNRTDVGLLDSLVEMRYR